MKIFQSLPFSLCRFLRDEKAATAIEYGLIAAGIAGAIIATVMAMGPTIAGMYEKVTNAWQ
jgi:pilus assembly protein Flp/PilA